MQAINWTDIVSERIVKVFILDSLNWLSFVVVYSALKGLPTRAAINGTDMLVELIIKFVHLE